MRAVHDWAFTPRTASAAAQRGADRDQRPAQAAGLGVGEGRQASFAQALTAVAGQDVPEVVGAAGAPPEPGTGMGNLDLPVSCTAYVGEALAIAQRGANGVAASPGNLRAMKIRGPPMRFF